MQGGWHAIGWRPDILSRRIICWLSQAPFVLQDADARFFADLSAVCRGRSAISCHTLKESREGLPRLQAIIALSYLTFCMQGQSGHLRANVRRLIEELRKQVLPDGGNISRTPAR